MEGCPVQSAGRGALGELRVWSLWVREEFLVPVVSSPQAWCLLMESLVIPLV